MSTPRLNRLERNALHNGNFDFWQRGTSVSVGSGAKTYQADRWAISRSGFTITYARSTDIPTGLPEATYSASFAVTGTSTATSRFADLITHLEGYDWSQFIGKSAYLQFWVKSSVAGYYGVALGFGGSEPTKFVQEFQISQADTWELKQILIPTVPSAAWNITNGLGARLSIIASRGSDFNTAQPVGQWSAAHLQGTANIGANTWGSSNTHVFRVAQPYMIPVEDSFSVSAAGTFRFVRAARTIAEELEICERYFEKSYDLTVNPGTITSVGQRHQHKASASTSAGPTTYFKVRKRTTPTVVSYSPSTGVVDTFNRDNSQLSVGSYSWVGESSFNSDMGGSSTATNYQFHWHYTADAEM